MEPENKNQQKNCVFKGPAGQTFSTLEDQANAVLNHHWPNWSENKSYLIPPIFAYKNNQHSRVTIEKWEIEKVNDETVKDYYSDEAEHIVYKAIDQLRLEGIKAPFIAIHGWKPKEKLLKTIFPEFPVDDHCIKQCLRQHDFVLIGPKIGIMAIEAKYPKYDTGFPSGRLLWNETYKDGLVQLKRAKNIPYFLQKCTGYPAIGMEVPNISTILCTPNFDEEIFRKWKNSLTPLDQDLVTREVGQTKQFFKTSQQQLYQNLKEFLESLSPISDEIYQIYAPIFAALSSITISQTKVVDLAKVNFSESGNIQQNKGRLKDLNKGVAQVIFLTPQQQTALSSCSRQFLMGTAGTGKTILLQEKAKQLIENNTSVTVLTTENYEKWYRAFFKENRLNEEKYKIIYWVKLADFWNFAAMAQKLDQEYRGLQGNLDMPTMFASLFSAADFIREKNDGKCDELKWLFGTDSGISSTSNDAIIIDDAVDAASTMVYPAGSLLLYVFIMILAEKLCPEKVIWVALDPYTTYANTNRSNDYIIYVEILKNLFLQNWVWSDYFKDSPNGFFKDDPDILQKGQSNYFSVIPLRQVMRCSTNILEAYLKEMDLRTMPLELTPVSGHNVSGKVEIEEIKVEGKFSDAKVILWEKVKKEIMQALQQSIKLGTIAVLSAGGGMDEKAKEFVSKQVKECWSDMVNMVNMVNIDKPNRSKSKSKSKEPNQKDLVIMRWMDTSSLEWTVVIGITCFAKGSLDIQGNAITYSHYRFMSRATSKLVMIKVIYDEDEIDSDSDLGFGLGFGLGLVLGLGLGLGIGYFWQKWLLQGKII